MDPYFGEGIRLQRRVTDLPSSFIGNYEFMTSIDTRR